jgi:hypothetical protein
VTTVRLALLAPTSDGTGRRPTGSLEFKPTKRRNVAGDVVLPAAFSKGLTDPPSTAELAPTEPGWAWQVIERTSGGSPRSRYVTVPDTAEVVDYADLVAVDPATLEPTEEPEAAWWAALHTVATVTQDPDDPDALLVGGTAVATDPDDSDALILTGV